jgi:hypothetical protein
MPDANIFFAVAKVLFFGVLDSFDASATGVVVFFSLLSCITSDLRGKWNLYETRVLRGGIVLLAPEFREPKLDSAGVRGQVLLASDAAETRQQS